MNEFKVRSKVWLESGEELVFGSGRAEILRAVYQTGSLSKAADQLNMSYRRIWSYIHAVEVRLPRPLLKKSKGGKGGGGAELTEYGVDVLKKFTALEEELRRYTDKQFKQIFMR